jgi:hypothetical protein
MKEPRSQKRGKTVEGESASVLELGGEGRDSQKPNLNRCLARVSGLS